MGNPIILYDNALDEAELSASDTESGSDILDIIDSKDFTSWEADGSGTKYIVADFNKTINGGFETGDDTGWTDNGAGTINYDNVSSHDGTYCLEITAPGAGQPSVLSDAGITVDVSKTHTFSYYKDMSVYTSGDIKFQINFYDNEDNLISGVQIETIGSLGGAYTKSTWTIGPGGDAEFPAGTATVKIQFITASGADLTMLIDDVLFFPNLSADALGILEHNLFSSNATTAMDSSDDDTEVITGWTERLTGFTPPDDTAVIEAFTARAPRAWRIRIITANIAPFLSVVIIGSIIQFPNPQRTPLLLRDEEPIMESNRAIKGSHLGTVRSYVELLVDVRIPVPSLAWHDANFLPFWDSHASLGKPYLFAWDLDTYPDLIYWVKIVDGFRYRQPFTTADPVDEIRLSMEAVKEE